MLSSDPGTALQSGQLATAWYRPCTVKEFANLMTSSELQLEICIFPTRSLVEQIIFDIINGTERNENDRFEDAVTIFRQICLDEDHFPTFLTLSAYSQFLVSAPGGPIR